MAHRRIAKRDGRRVAFLVAYDEQVPESIVIPEDLTDLSDEELAALTEQADAAFTDLYGDGHNLSADTLAALNDLTEGLVALHAEADRRAAEAAERDEQAAALAARVRPVPVEDDTAEVVVEDNPTDDDEGEQPETDEAEVEQPEAIAASARREVRVNLSHVRSRQSSSAPRPVSVPQTMRDVVMAAPDVPGFSNGQGMDFDDLGRAVAARLQSFNPQTYEAAHKAGRHMRQQFGVASIHKPFEQGLILQSDGDVAEAERVFAHAADESRLPGGSLVASGGWCAPSEVLYDLYGENESRDGLFSVPEVGISRGGVRWTKGPDFADLFAEITGFAYTEEQDIAGTYGVDENGVGDGSAGSKPCYKVGCPDFEEARLEPDGLCITAGLLQRRGYPEVIARTIRGALVGHDHRLAGRKVARIASLSTAITMPSPQVGATAPLLTAIELQVEHYRTIRRMNRNTSLEAVFPTWVHAVVRADLSRRLGVDMFSVPNARINGWFTERGVNPQFIYDWQDIGATAATGFTQWPTTVDFLLYAAGTWVVGGADVITLDTIYDSVMLGENDYTALFTEEAWLLSQRGHDSRKITVSICPDGGVGAGVAIDCDGTTGSPT